MYKHIDSNRHKSWLLIGVFIGILSAAGYVYGMVTDSGYVGLIFALLLSIGMALVSWYAGDKIALSMAQAKEITHQEQNAYIWNLVENCCITAGIPKPRIYLIEDSALNAFATGRNPSKASIALTTGLVQALENEELEGVIAHELSHVKNYDSRFMILVAVLVGSLTLLGHFFWSRRWSSRRSDQGGGNIFFLIGVLFLILSPIIGELIKLAISRKREYLADASGALLTRYPEGLARALEKIRDSNTPVSNAPEATAHLWIANPFGPSGRGAKWFAGLFSTHPPIEDRIRQLRQMEGNL